MKQSDEVADDVEMESIDNSELFRIANTTMATLQTTTLSTLSNLTASNTTAILSNGTAPTTMLPSVNTTTAATTTTTTAATTAMPVTTTGVVTTTASKLTTLVPLPDGSSSSGLIFLSMVLFIVAIAVIAKIIYSNRKRSRSDLIGGTARWRLAASQQSGTGPQQTAASYAPMDGTRPANGTNGLDTPGPDRLDWERQFFDDTEATVPSRLQLDLSRT